MIELAEIAEAAVEHFAEKEAYKEIQPVGEKNPEAARNFFDDIFNKKSFRNEVQEPKNPRQEVQDGKTYYYDKNGELYRVDDELAPDSKCEIDAEYFSTYEERLNQTPREDSDLGKWDGERGESKFIPNDQEIKAKLAERGLEGIDYKDGIPDFSEVSESTVEIDNMAENRAENFKKADEECAKRWNEEQKGGRTDWTARDVSQWRKENGYSWHERNDMKTCDLIPTKINAYFGHLGGVSECRKRDEVNYGGDFDE